MDTGADTKALQIECRSTHQPRPRLRHAIGPWRPVIAPTCIDCGLCVEVCPTDVFHYMPGRRHLAVPREERCLGMVACGACAPACPADAITIMPSQNWAVLGDGYMSNAIIASIWEMAEHGTRSPEDPVSVSTSGRGFDRLGFVVPEGQPALLPEQINLRVSLHHRGRELWVELPVIGEAVEGTACRAPTEMAREDVTLARAAAAKALGTLTTFYHAGEAFSSTLAPYADWLILRVTRHVASASTTGEAVLARVPAIALYPPFDSVRAIEDLTKQLDWLRLVNPQALLIVTLEPSISVAKVAAGAARAGAHVIHLCSGESAASLVLIADRVRAVHRYLQAEGLRDQVTLVAGGMRTPLDVLKAIALGADAGAVGLAERVALGGVPYGQGKIGDGCLREEGDIDPVWGAHRLVNMYLAWAAEFRRVLALLSLSDVRALRGRADLLALVE